VSASLDPEPQREPQPAMGAPPKRAVRIGLTGPIGCGKSTVASWLSEMGANVIDADQVAREVTPPGSAELAAIGDAFGIGILRGDGTLDRAALGRIVFTDPAALRRLEAIIHPAVRPRMLAAIEAAEASGAAGVVIEAIKLVEGGLAADCDEVWLVACDPDVQRDRLLARDRDHAAPAEGSGSVEAAIGQPAPGATAAHERARAGTPPTADASATTAADEPAGAVARALADAEARIAAQGDLVARLTPLATRVIDTSGSIAESRSRVEAAWAAALNGSAANAESDP
jgi:dephospho-CoA kinase